MSCVDHIPDDVLATGSNPASSFEQEFDNIWVIKGLKLVQGQRFSNDAGHKRRS